MSDILQTAFSNAMVSHDINQVQQMQMKHDSLNS